MKNTILSRALGAQVVSATVNQHQIFYCSQQIESGKPERGGVPIIFPQFADNGPLQKHGFCRVFKWTCVLDEKTAQMHRQKFILSILPNTEPKWPHGAFIESTIEVSIVGFIQELKIKNTGLEPFKWTGGLHPYFSVSNLSQSRVIGLENISYKDRYRSGDLRYSSAEMSFSNEACEKLFDSAPSLLLINGPRRIMISTSGFDQWMIWNPGKNHGLVDLPNKDWQSFICIEPVIVSEPYTINPGENFLGRLIVRVD